MCDCARPAGIVQDADFSLIFQGGGFKGGGRVEEVDADPVHVLVDEGGDFLEEVALPLLGRV